MPADFTVIVPVYNTEPYLRQCFDSILGQTCGSLELIIVDDGSSDGSAAICDEYAARDDRVTVVHQPNSGVVTARRRALELARADYVCFVDSDDYVADTWLETMKGHADANGRPDMLLFGYIDDDNGRLLPPEPLPAEAGYYDKKRLTEEVYPYMIYDRRKKPFLTQLIPGYQCTKIYARGLLQAYYIRDPSITIFEDACFVYELLYHADSLYVCPEHPYFYRWRDGSVLGSYKPDYFRSIRRCYDYMHAHLGGVSEAIDLQISGFIAEKTMKAIAHEFVHRRPFGTALRHIRGELTETGLPGVLRLSGLPLYAGLYIALLKCRCYWLSAVIAAVWRGLVRLIYR